MSITCKSLDHIYGYNTPFEYYALKNVNLKIEKGSFTAIMDKQVVENRHLSNI